MADILSCEITHISVGWIGTTGLGSSDSHCAQGIDGQRDPLTEATLVSELAGYGKPRGCSRPPG